MPSKILILRLSSIGDILLATPFIQQVKKTFPEAEITFIVKKEFNDLLKHNKHIDKLISFDPTYGIAGLLDLTKQLKSRNFDYIFDLHNNLRTNRLTSGFKGNKVYKIKKYKFKRSVLVNFKINLFRQIKSAPEKYLLVGAESGVKDNGEQLELYWDETTETKIEEHLNENNLQKDRYICIAPGAAHFTKMWPLEYSVNLIERIINNSNLKIVILGGPGEEKILQQGEPSIDIINFCGKLSLLESAVVLKYSKGIITNDSGLMHMAAAVKKSIIALFGSTVKEFGFFPFRADATILENKDLWCRPCTHIGRRNCPLGHFNCMRQITVDRVFKEVSRKFFDG